MIGRAKEFISYLKKASGLGIECPCCERIIPTKSADLFLESELSKRAIQFRDGMVEEIKELKDELIHLKTTKLEKLAVTTMSVNVGKILEKFAPILKGFNYSPHDCRGLFEPIDYIVFHGITKGTISHIEFLDIKSGKARLKASQREIRDVVEAGKIQLQIFGSRK